MINKAYEKIKQFIKDNYKYIITWVLIYLFFTIPTNSYIITGGGIINIEEKVKITDSYKQKGSLNFSYVEELKGTVATYLLSLIVPSYENESIDEYKINSNETYKDIEFRDKLQLKKANNAAVYNAYNKANKSISEISNKIYVIYKDSNSDTDLIIGDQILQVDNIKVDTLDSYKDYINSKDIGDIVSIKVLNNKKEYKRSAKVYKYENRLITGVGVEELTTYKLNPKLKLKFNKSESGPSGGLMLTLQIYNKLTKEDITKNRKIVGTGTIDKEGNIGEIAGIKYKLMGAVKNKADIFIVPKTNLNEALKEKKKNNYKIKIIGVSTFDEALEKLK